ncbi:MAG: hypothetical protein NTX49_07090 [Chlamydiae bacterium]|nr:hypothetical protein [Chlamydiota bacterium]
MANLTCSIGQSPFGVPFPSLPITTEAPLTNSVPAIAVVAGGVALAALARLGGCNARQRGGALPRAIQAGAGIIMDRVAIGVRSIYGLKNSWDQYWRGLNVIEAARTGSSEQVASLLASGPISDVDRGLAIINATCRQDIVIITSLLTSGPISEKDRGTAIYYAASTGNAAIANLLLNGGLAGSGPISEIDRGKAAVEAITYLQISNQQGNRQPEILETIRLILASGTISDEDRGLATAWAAGGIEPGYIGYRGRIPHIAYPEIIRSLLTSGEITELYRGIAVKAAAGSNSSEMVTLLLEGTLAGCGTISPEARGDAVDLAANLGHVNMVRQLLDPAHPIPNEFRGSATLAAISKRRTDIVTLLLASGPISFHRPDDRITTIREASINGYEGVLRAIHAAEGVSQGQLGMAVREASYNGRLECVRFLVGIGPIPENDRQSAIFWCVYPAIVALLQGAQPNALGQLHARGVNVHADHRDELTRPAVELLIQATGPMSPKEIKDANQEFLAYLRSMPASTELTRAEKAVIGPRKPGESYGPLQPDDTFTIHGLAISGEESIARFWRFCNTYEDRAPGANIENEKENARYAMIRAFIHSYDDFGIVCNPGKIQRLVVEVLQGRLPGVRIDTVAAAAPPAMNAQGTIQSFWADTRHQAIETRAALRDAVNIFLEENAQMGGFRNELLANVAEFAAQQEFPAE